MPGSTDLHTVPAKALRVCMVVPCYNEAGVLQHTTEVLLNELTSLAMEGYATADSYVCCVDDGSRCLLYTSDAADERSSVDLGGRRIIKKKKQATQ